MLSSSKSFLAVDFGAGSLKLAEFEITEAGALSLKNYGVKSLGLEGSQESKREATILRATQELLGSKAFGAKNVNVCAPGFHVFSKFVKLPPVDESKVTQIIQYEAQQNVPFPLEEVVWDYQILGTLPSGELEVLLVAIKADIVEGLFRTADAAGLRLQLVDVSPAALCNAFRYNYSDLEGCSMLLDIGAKTSNVLFFEKGKVYARSINIGANSITQDYATEAKIKFPDAEDFKIAEGFVSLGGAYEEPESEKQAKISKIARQVMTRLHIQVNQTLQFYRGQQGGSAPQRLFLSGGASIMPYTAQFFAEKLNVAVEYFNPLRNVQINPGINLEELAKVAHSLGEVVGLALRNLAQCPIELNLMPKSSLNQQKLSAKKPYFIATLCSVVLVALAVGWFSYSVSADKQATLDFLNTQLGPIEKSSTELAGAQGNVNKFKQEADTLTALLEDKTYWVEMMGELRRVFLQTEQDFKRRQGIDAGVWIEKFTAGKPPAAFEAASSEDSEEKPKTQWNEAMMKRYGKFLRPPGSAEAGGDSASTDDATGKPKPVGKTNEIETVSFTCRGVNLNTIKPTHNKDLAFTLDRELQAATNFFTIGTNASFLTKDSKLVVDSNNTNTFTFEVTLKLKRPVKLF
ncbi:MAG: type IV pilus assembly protein PilM [Verrucomicrobia bacterium]|nr:type IV pilus assembly protein PilM [Verrucomicrobiota bacterium]